MHFFVIEGLDGSGKSTQIGLLQKHLTKKGIPFKYLHFPRTDSEVFGDLIARFLRGELGDIHSVNPYLIALIYAGDRMDASGMIRGWLKEGYLVLLDRYVHSNIAFQCAKLADTSERQLLKEWINYLEYEYFNIPKPLMSLFLDVPFSFTKKKLSQQRFGTDRDYLQGFRDIHENNLDFQEKVREMYLWQVAEENDFKLVDCSDGDGEMLSQDKIFGRLLESLKLN